MKSDMEDLACFHEVPWLYLWHGPGVLCDWASFRHKCILGHLVSTLPGVQHAPGWVWDQRLAESNYLRSLKKQECSSQSNSEAEKKEWKSDDICIISYLRLVYTLVRSMINDKSLKYYTSGSDLKYNESQYKI